MPPRLLRDGKAVTDDWTYLAAGGANLATDGANLSTGGANLSTGGSNLATDGAYLAAGGDARASAAGAGGLILSFDQWRAERAAWTAAPGRLGVVLAPAHRVELLAPDLPRFALIAAEFPGPSEGRGYTQARLLRERYRFAGELRAIGYVRRDQLYFLARCGFNSFELPEADLAAADRDLHTFSAEYQPANDAGLAFKPQRRQ